MRGVEIDVEDLPGALQDFLPYVVTEVDPFLSPLSRCNLTTPHNKHRWGEGMQDKCVGIPGIAAGVTPERMERRIGYVDQQIRQERDRIAEAQRRLEDRLLERQNLVLAKVILDRLNTEAPAS